jgi:hypothetical protein
LSVIVPVGPEPADQEPVRAIAIQNITQTPLTFIYTCNGKSLITEQFRSVRQILVKRHLAIQKMESSQAMDMRIIGICIRTVSFI